MSRFILIYVQGVAITSAPRGFRKKGRADKVICIGRIALRIVFSCENYHQHSDLSSSQELEQ